MTEFKPRRSPTYRRTEGWQNRSPAIMSQRTEPADSLDDFPTPRWATRALVEHVLNPAELKDCDCWEPTCGRGYMAATLAEYFRTVRSSDIAAFGYGQQIDFLNASTDTGPDIQPLDWVITNPPFRLAEEFARCAYELAKVGSAMLVRTGFLEGAGRYRRLFRDHPPAIVAQFVERVPILRARVDPKASTATGYCWIVWLKAAPKTTRLVWIPPCRRRLERSGDYDDPRVLSIAHSDTTISTPKMERNPLDFLES